MTNLMQADLLIIGLGPVGDTLAGLARLHGLSVIAIDQANDILPHPRAAVFDHEIMRIFQMLGVAKSIEPATHLNKKYQFVTADRQILLDFDTEHQITSSGWADTYALHQPGVERALRQRLQELGVTLHLGARLLTLHQTEHNIAATIEQNGETQIIHANYAIGCDGAASTVRSLMATTLFDYQFDEPWLVLDTVISAPTNLPDQAMQICDPQRPVTYIRMGAHRYRWEFMIKPGENPAGLLTDESLKALLAPFNCADQITIERKAVYRFHGLVATQWQDHRILLAGDAAHQMPPFAGQGMCSGLRDAVNLAWKLAAIITGQAAASLLASYQSEREPHVRQIIERAIAMGRVVCLLDPVAAQHRNAEMLARKAACAEDISLSMPNLENGCLTKTPAAGSLFPQWIAEEKWLDDQLGLGAWLITNQPAPPALACGRIFALDHQALKPFVPQIQNWLAAHQAEAVLVRPDRVVFGTGNASNLIAQWHAHLQTTAPAALTTAA